MIYCLLSFLGAFALFLLEPFLGKVLTPRFGGGAQVWILCMLFFQVVLLGGYAYAHLNADKVPPKRQGLVHLSLLGLVLAAMAWAWARQGDPLIPAPGGEDWAPTLGVLILLGRSAALPMIALAATSPLIQMWYARDTGGQAPYRLYAWSNAGSIGGLLAYPFAMEPWMSTHAQGVCLFFLVAAFAAGLAFLISRQNQGDEQGAQEDHETSSVPRLGQATWVLASATGTLILMAMTNKLSMEIVAMPLIWILPLLLYLLSFILVFDAKWGLGEGGWTTAWLVLAAMSLGLVFTVKNGINQPWRLILECATFTFAGCMACHGYLHASRPSPRHLTRFYFLLSLGGVVGGIFVALLAPVCFDRVYEVGIATLLLGFIGAMASRGAGPKARWVGILGAGLVLAVGLGSLWQERSGRDLMSRNFYGVLKVKMEGPLLMLQNLKTLHGLVDLGHPRQPMTYYSPESGIGRTLRMEMARKPALKVGVVGLGIGTVADYGRPSDQYTFYEINPEVIDLAGPHSPAFPVLRLSQAKVEVVEGDGRLCLERELKLGQPRGYDVLMVDAFAGDAVPWHLLTLQAFRTYLAHLAPDGLLIFHVSNPLPVDRVVLAAARDLGLYGAYLIDYGNPRDRYDLARMMNLYIVMAVRPEPLRDPLIESNMLTGFGPKVFKGETENASRLAFLYHQRAWTDERCSLSGLLFQEPGGLRIMAEMASDLKRTQAAQGNATPRQASPSTP